MLYTYESMKRVLTPWGLEVKKRLKDKNARQSDLIRYLNEKGFEIEKAHLTNLLFGIGISSREGEIREISKFLGIEISDK